MGSQSFKEVKAWQLSYELTIAVYELSKQFPKDELYGLTNQIKRAAVSVPSNIAEGFGWRGDREKDNFYSIAHGSLTEVENQLLIAKGVGYITEQDLREIEPLVVEVHKTLYGLRKANKQKGEMSN